MALAMRVLIPIGTIAKVAVGRPRPVIHQADFFDGICVNRDYYRFTSGHAIIVSAGAAVLLSMFIGSNRKPAVSTGLTVEAVALVSLSREYMLVIIIHRI